MKTIHKYNIHPSPPEDHCVVNLPLDAKILHAAFQKDKLCLWALVDMDSDTLFVERSFVVIPTGMSLADSFNELHQYVSTATTTEGFVFHVFEFGVQR